MLSAILSAISGGLLRALPEVVSLWNKKEDNDHERQMMDKQIQLETLQAANKLAVQSQQFDAEKVISMLGAQKDSLSDQLRPMVIPLTGIKWLDAIDAIISTVTNALNMLVRPLTTYYFLALFGAYKTALLAQALSSNDIWSSILLVYSESDSSMLGGIIGFWFVGRTFDKLRK